MDKNKKHKLVFKTIIIIFAFLHLCILAFMHSSSVFAYGSPNYPIPELDYCRDEKECYLYCQIPVNTPACWSYGKYIMNSKESQVLGETAVNLTYPIAELGSCASAQDCFIYCSQPQNQVVCVTYATGKGLVKPPISKDEENEPPANVVEDAKTELGCRSKVECMSFCSKKENMEKCHAFAQKHGMAKNSPSDLPNGPPAQVMLSAKEELGCNSEGSCKDFCEREENRKKCLEFAQKHNLMKGPPPPPQNPEVSQKMMEEAKKEFGCDSFETCGRFCEKSENRPKCDSLAKKYGFQHQQQSDIPKPPTSGVPSQKIPPQQMSGTPPPFKGPEGCTNEEECRKYCEKNPSDCPGLLIHKPQLTPSSQISPQYKPAKATQLSPGDFLGPAGCKTEAECKAYCEKHPKECPGLPPKNMPSNAPGQYQFSPLQIISGHPQPTFNPAGNPGNNPPDNPSRTLPRQNSAQPPMENNPFIPQ